MTVAAITAAYQVNAIVQPVSAYSGPPSTAAATEQHDEVVAGHRRGQDQRQRDHEIDQAAFRETSAGPADTRAESRPGRSAVAAIATRTDSRRALTASALTGLLCHEAIAG